MLHIVLEVPFVFDMVLLSDQWVWNGLVVIAKKGNLLIFKKITKLLALSFLNFFYQLFF